MAWLEQGFDQSQDMRSWISPSLIEANHILSLSQQELQALVEQEMAQNPALELESRVRFLLHLIDRRLTQGVSS